MWCGIAFVVGIVFTLIYAVAIVRPRRLRINKAANQAYVITSLRMLNNFILNPLPPAGVVWGNFPPTQDYPRMPATLEAPLPAPTANLIDDVLGSGQINTYIFTYTPRERDAEGRVKTYAIRADPLELSIHYFIDQTRVVRQETDRPASEQSPPFVP